MKTKFTKGEWAFQKFGDKYILTAQHGMREIILSANNGGSLVMNQGGILKPLDPNHPNAKLIMAAPELFEALESILFMATGKGVSNGCKTWDDAELKAINAIKGATE